MVLPLGEVVVAVDPFGLPDRAAGPGFKLPDHAVHHLLAVEQGEVLRPPQLGDVPVELRRALLEVGEIAVRQVDPGVAADPLRDGDVVRLDADRGELTALVISPAAVDPEDTETLAELVDDDLSIPNATIPPPLFAGTRLGTKVSTSFTPSK